MRRATFLVVFATIMAVFSTDLAAQQSSRRTRPIAPRGDATKTSTVEQVQQNTTEVAQPTAPKPAPPERIAAAPLQEPARIRVADDGEFTIHQVGEESPKQLIPRTSIEAVGNPVTMGAQTTPANSDNGNVVQSSHALSTRIVTSSEINIGQPAELTLFARNDGRSNMDGVNLTIHLSEHVEFVGADPKPADQTESMAVWKLPEMAAGQESQIRLRVVPYAKQPMSIETEFTIIDRNRVSIDVRQPDVKMAVSTSKLAVVNQEVVHQVRIWNEGDGTVNDLEINLGMASDMKLVDGNGETVNVGTLKPGEEREMTIRTRASQSGDSPVVFQLAGAGVNVEQVNEIKIIVPELYAEILGPKVNIPQREGTYTINVNNPCEIPITATSVTLQIPDGMEVTLLSRAGEFNEKTRTISWKLGDMAPGGEDTLQFKALLTGNTDQQCIVMVDGQETTSNQLAFETRAYNHTELKLAMKNETGPVNIGDTAQFLVTATNTGHTVASEVQVEVEIPTWIKPDADPAYDYDAENSRLVFKAVDVPDGMSAEFRFTGKCSSAGSFVVRSFLRHASQDQPMISDAGLFVLDSQTEKVGSIISGDKKTR